MTRTLHKGNSASLGPTVSLQHPSTPAWALAGMSPAAVQDDYGLDCTPVRSGWQVTYGLNLPGELAHQIGGQLDAWSVLMGAGLSVDPPEPPEYLDEQDKEVYRARVKRLLQTKQADAVKLQRSRKGGIDMAKSIRIKAPSGALSAQEKRAWHGSHAGLGYEHHIIEAKGYENLLLKMPPHLRHEHGAHLLAQRELHLEAAEREKDAPVKSASDTGIHSSTLSPRSSKKSRRDTMFDFDSIYKADNSTDHRRRPMAYLKNSKPIYDTIQNRRHNKFTPAEHREAADMHSKMAMHFASESKKHAGTEHEAGLKEITQRNRDLAASHRDMARQKAGKSLSYSWAEQSDALLKADNSTDHRRRPMAYLKNSKPIYDTIQNRRHNKFTPAEHREAADMHSKMAMHFASESKKHAGTEHEAGLKEITQRNRDLASSHREMARQKTGKSIAFSWSEDSDDLLKADNSTDHRRRPMAYLKNSKPIYDTIQNRRHNKFTPAEHREAADMHSKMAMHFASESKKHAGTEHEAGLKEITQRNRDLAASHRDMARQKAGKSLTYSWAEQSDALLKADNSTDHRRRPMAYLKNSKPIYDTIQNRRHNKFTPAEHREAADMHSKMAMHFASESKKHAGTEHEAGLKEITQRNRDLAASHRDMARQKAGKSRSVDGDDGFFEKGDATGRRWNPGDIIVKSDMAQRILERSKKR